MVRTMAGSLEAIETLIIGAGAAGLAVGQALAQRKRPFVLVERAEAIGASWRNRYDRLHLHTAKRYSSLPGLRFPASAPTYPSRQQVVDYLTSYAERFGIAPRFGSQVERVAPDPAGGGWLTRTSRGDFRSSHVVVATGFNAVPVSPRWPGMETFSGEILHSAAYRRPDAWTGQRVLVVGSGNSGAEIALDLLERGAQVDLCIRGKLHVTRRDTLGLPNPLPPILLSKLPLALADGIARATIRLVVGDLTRWGIEAPDCGPFRAIAETARIPMVDVGTLARIKKGELPVRKGIERFNPDGVTFVDGRRERYGAVVLATGFRAGLDQFLEGAADLLDDRGRRRSPTVQVLPGLFLIGFVQPATGLLREIGRESSQVAAGIAAAS
jgi:indole-3-pyruvate monooxygenase